ncbi:hypothetical protein F5Y16DRAFT_364313 [Xylariaceae sp. FL0255]|nr:hypothetical protein F5Y16DRAFT_364313 [Xylariaceae sp. FL0255]
MASKAFFDPVVALRLAPVVTSCMAMRFSHDQWSFLSVFLSPENREKTNNIIPSYFKTFFAQGVKEIGALYTLTTGLGIYNFYARPNDAWKLYAAGTALAVFHMAFAPLIIPSIKALHDDEPKGQGGLQLRNWLDIHTIRSNLADVPAWACFTIACIKSLQPISDLTLETLQR